MSTYVDPTGRRAVHLDLNRTERRRLARLARQAAHRPQPAARRPTRPSPTPRHGSRPFERPQRL